MTAQVGNNSISSVESSGGKPPAAIPNPKLQQRVQDVAQPKIGFCGKMCEFLEGLVTSKISNVIVITAATVLLFLFVSNLAGWIVATVGAAFLAARFMPLAGSGEQPQLLPSEQQQPNQIIPSNHQENQRILEIALISLTDEPEIQKVVSQKAQELSRANFITFCAAVTNFFERLKPELNNLDSNKKEQMQTELAKTLSAFSGEQPVEVLVANLREKERDWLEPMRQEQLQQQLQEQLQQNQIYNNRINQTVKNLGILGQGISEEVQEFNNFNFQRVPYERYSEKFKPLEDFITFLRECYTLVDNARLTKDLKMRILGEFVPLIKGTKNLSFQHRQNTLKEDLTKQIQRSEPLTLSPEYSRMLAKEFAKKD